MRQNPELEQTGGGRTASIADRTPLGFDDLLLVISTVSLDLKLLERWRLLAGFGEVFGEDW